MRNKPLLTISVLALLLLSGLAQKANAQTDSKGRKIIQLSGIVATQDGNQSLAGAHVFVPRRGQGTTTDMRGYFSLPVVPGDSVVFSSIGYSRQSFVVPEIEGDKITLAIEMIEDVTILPELAVMPFPTEEAFKQKILTTRVASTTERDNFNEELFQQMLRNAPVGPVGNYNYIVGLQNQAWQDRFGPRPLTFTNPFAWAQLFKSIKNGDFSK